MTSKWNLGAICVLFVVETIRDVMFADFVDSSRTVVRIFYIFLRGFCEEEFLQDCAEIMRGSCWGFVKGFVMIWNG